MILPADVSDQLDNALRTRVNEAYDRNDQNPTPENRAAYQQAFRVFVDWVMHGKLPDAIQDILTS